MLGVLNSAMGWFVLEEYIPVNPCAEIENLPTHTVDQGYTPTSAEVAQLLDEAHHRNFSDDPVTQATFGDERDLKTWMWHHQLLRLCAETGCRISEALTRDAYRCQHAGCGVHLQAGRRSPRSAVVHHLKPHKGDLELLFDLDNLQSVCWTCHSGDIQSQEALGYDTTIGADGWPVDPKHPSVA